MNLKKIINLSPLVDVLMIVIFWYIMMSNQTMEETKEAAREELTTMQKRYEAELSEAKLEYTSLEEQIEVYRNANNDLSNQLTELREVNSTLGMMLEQSVGCLYIRLYDGLHKNRIIEVNSDAELVDKFVFSSGEEEYLAERIRKVVTGYTFGEEKTRVVVVFLYEGNKAYYRDVTGIKNVLYELKTEQNISVFMLNLAE